MPDFDMPGTTSSFEDRGAWVLTHLMADLGLTQNQAAGIVGNLGGESGLKAIQEISPIAGRGGFGWAQWTGPRRDAFEAWCDTKGLTPVDDEANYGYLLVELQGDQAHSIEQIKKTTTLEAAVYTFEAIFERPADLQGTLPSRIHWAQRAIAGLHGIPAPPPPTPTPTPTPDPDNSADDLNRAELERIKAGESEPPPPPPSADEVRAANSAPPPPPPLPEPPPTPTLPPARTAPGVALTAGGSVTAMLGSTLQYIGPWWHYVGLPTPDATQAVSLAGLAMAAGGTAFHLWANKGPKT